MKYPARILFVLLCSIILNGCHRENVGCPPDREEYQEITYPPDKEVLKSYAGYDTLNFKSETGIIYTFIGQGLDSGYTVLSVMPDDNCISKVKIHKKYLGYFFESDNYPTDLQYIVALPNTNSNLPRFYINVNNYQFFTTSKLPPLGNSEYINNLIIDGYKYNNVLKIYKNWDYKEPNFLYYSIIDGVIKIFFSDGKTLTKIK